MAKVRVLNYWNGMNPSWRIGNEVEVDDKQVEGLVKSGSVETLSETRRAAETPDTERLTRPSGRR